MVLFLASALSMEMQNATACWSQHDVEYYIDDEEDEGGRRN